MKCMNDASRHHNPEMLLNLLLEAFFPPPQTYLCSPAHYHGRYCKPPPKNYASILLIVPGGRIPLTDPSPAKCWRHSTSTRCKIGGLLALSTGSYSYSLADPSKQKRTFPTVSGSTAISPTGTVISGTATPTGNSSTMSNGTTPYNGTFPGPPVPYTGGTGAIKSCGAVVVAGLLVGGMTIVL